MPRQRELTVPEQHQLNIALKTLKMPDAMVGVMGGMDKAEARRVIKRLTGKEPKENGAHCENPPLRAVRSIGNNRTEVDHGEVTVLYSYDTPVAVFSPNNGVFVTMGKFSATTSRHVSQWVNENYSSEVTVTKVPQSAIERMAEGGSVHGVDTFERNPPRRGKYDNDFEAGVHQYLSAAMGTGIGDVNGPGFYMMTDVSLAEVMDYMRDVPSAFDVDARDVKDDWLKLKIPRRVYVITREIEQDFVSVETFSRKRDFDAAVASVSEDVEVFYEDEDEV